MVTSNTWEQWSKSHYLNTYMSRGRRIRLNTLKRKIYILMHPTCKTINIWAFEKFQTMLWGLCMKRTCQSRQKPSFQRCFHIAPAACSIQQQFRIAQEPRSHMAEAIRNAHPIPYTGCWFVTTCMVALLCWQLNIIEGSHFFLQSTALDFVTCKAFGTFIKLNDHSDWRGGRWCGKKGNKRIDQYHSHSGMQRQY